MMGYDDTVIVQWSCSLFSEVLYIHVAVMLDFLISSRYSNVMKSLEYG